MTTPVLLHESGELNPWVPDNNRQNLRVLGKALEELGEGVAAIARCIIQGIDESEPVTGKPNRKWLTEEVADISAALGVVYDHFDLDMAEVAARADRKARHLAAWAELIKDIDK